MPIAAEVEIRLAQTGDAPDIARLHSDAHGGGRHSSR